MSYPLSLDECSLRLLIEEVERRFIRVSTNRCPYCASPLPTPGLLFCVVCRFGSDLNEYHQSAELGRLKRFVK